MKPEFPIRGAPPSSEQRSARPRSAEQGSAEQRSAEQRSAEQRLQSGGAEIAQATITLLRELEGSIQASQRALLSRDLAGLEQRSHEQIGLLEILWSRVAAHSIDPTGPILESQEDRSRDALPQARDLALAAELRSAEMRVLHLGRVQAALLVRAQRWLNILSNLIAGPEASYAAPTCNRASEYAARPADSSQEEAEEGDRCRV